MRILLVEDNPLIQRVTQSLLQGEGFVVDIAGTGAEALSEFSNNTYQLIYMDIGLPDQDGYTATQAIRTYEKAINLSPVPIIALTAHGTVDVEGFCARVGMQGVLSKPLTREQAKAVWVKFVLGQKEEVAGFVSSQSVDPAIEPAENQIIDLEGTIELLGSPEYARELLTLWREMLEHRFLPAIKDFVDKHDDEALRQELHTMLGSLCYVKTPLLNQAILALQFCARNHPHTMAAAYQHVEEEAQRFITYYERKYS